MNDYDKEVERLYLAGQRFPYDSNDELPEHSDWTVRAARGVMYALSDNFEFGDIGLDACVEIVGEVAAIIRFASLDQTDRSD